MLTGWIVYHDDLLGAHFALIIYLSCLSSSSHLAAIVTLRKYFEENQTLALFRITIIGLLAVLLSLSISLTSAFAPFYFLLFYVVTERIFIGPLGVEVFISIVPILWTFGTGIWQIVPTLRSRFQAWLKRVIWPWVKRAGVGRCWSWVEESSLNGRARSWGKSSGQSRLTHAFFHQ